MDTADSGLYDATTTLSKRPLAVPVLEPEPEPVPQVFSPPEEAAVISPEPVSVVDDYDHVLVTPPAKREAWQMNNMRGKLVDLPEVSVRKRAASVDNICL